MSGQINRRQVLGLGAGFGALTLLAACDTTGFGPAAGGSGASGSAGAAPMPQSFGTGPVKVALLLPLSGDAGLAVVGTSMANAAQLAIEYVSANPKIGDNITLLLKDTGPTPGEAAQRASEALSEGAKLILGPLKAEQVQAAGGVAKSAGVPLIGFSNNTTAAAPGVYLLNVLPETEVHRSLTYAMAKGRKSTAAVFSTSDFGRSQQAAFQTVAAGLNVTARTTFNFTTDADMRNVVSGLAPQIAGGAVDSIFLPDRATAPGFATLLQKLIPKDKVLIIGSADWDTDPTILATPYLSGAVYPAVDDTGYQALSAEYATRFGGKPHPLATIAYTAVILANAAPLSRGKPPYSTAQLTTPGGFNGRDGVFRFLSDGRSQYALIMKQVAVGGAIKVDGPKL